MFNMVENKKKRGREETRETPKQEIASTVLGRK